MTPPFPSDMQCRAIVGDSTRSDAVVDRCTRFVVLVDDATNPEAEYWSIWCRQHRTQAQVVQLCGDRDPQGNRRVGPQRIMKGQVARG